MKLDEPIRAGTAPRIAYLSYSSGEFDARTIRMARSAVKRGYEVTVYARWHPGLPQREDRDGYALIRAPFSWKFAIPGLRGGARRRGAAAMARAAADHAVAAGADNGLETDPPGIDDPDDGPKVDGPYGVARSLLGPLWRRLLPLWRVVRIFPLRPMGWAVALDDVSRPADIWHGMWAGSLPALERMRRRHGGRTIYDSRDVYMQSRDFARLRRPLRSVLVWAERRWAHAADRVLTVNDAYAELLIGALGIPRPPVVMNCPEVWVPPSPRPDRIRAALGLPSETDVVLYQGGLMSERGIEQAMDAILLVPNAVLVLLGYGGMLERLTAQAAEPPYLGRVHLLPPVPPDELLMWTASADVLVMAIQPTTPNHLFTTPQKLFEGFAAGTPVVASDLPGMARIVKSTGAGVLCDPTSPASIAAGIRSILGAPKAERQNLRDLALRAAHDRYNWEAQTATLFDQYQQLAGPHEPVSRSSDS